MTSWTMPSGYPLGRPHVFVSEAESPASQGSPVVFRGDEDGFVVDEIPAYMPSGQGEHLYLHIEKRGLSTPQVTKRLAVHFGLKEREIGYAGQKDARGVTRQWLSVPARIMLPRVDEVADAVGVKLLTHSRHNNKLRLGHTHGNRFTCRLDNVDAEAAVRIGNAATQMSRFGMPNWFGAQRFGHDDRALRDAERFLAFNKKAISRREQFWISAFQSALWNAWLALRIEEGSWRSAVDGDVLMKRDTGAPFLCVDPATDTARCDVGEVAPSGPMYGRAMRRAERDALTRESRSLARLSLTEDELLAHIALDTGTRRPARVFAGDLTHTYTHTTMTVSFTLGPGSYASVFLQELVGARLQDAFFAPTADSRDDA